MKAIMVHLWHPCREIDVWVVETEEDKAIALRQGYMELEEVRAAVAITTRTTRGWVSDED